jgi:hypothetical protein
MAIRHHSPRLGRPSPLDSLRPNKDTASKAARAPTTVITATDSGTSTQLALENNNSIPARLLLFSEWNRIAHDPPNSTPASPVLKANIRMLRAQKLVIDHRMATALAALARLDPRVTMDLALSSVVGKACVLTQDPIEAAVPTFLRLVKRPVSETCSVESD